MKWDIEGTPMHSLAFAYAQFWAVNTQLRVHLELETFQDALNTLKDLRARWNEYTQAQHQFIEVRNKRILLSAWGQPEKNEGKILKDPG